MIHVLVPILCSRSSIVPVSLALRILRSWGRLERYLFWLVFSEGCTVGLRWCCCCCFQSLEAIRCGLFQFFQCFPCVIALAALFVPCWVFVSASHASSGVGAFVFFVVIFSTVSTFLFRALAVLCHMSKVEALVALYEVEFRCIFLWGVVSSFDEHTTF